MAAQALTADDLDFTTLARASAKLQRVVFAHVRTLNPERDDEEPVSYAKWMFEHGIFKHPRPTYRKPHQIYLAWLKDTATLVDIAGFVPDDRDVGLDLKLAEEDPYYLGFFGGHNVHPDYRGRDVGKAMIAHRIEAVRSYVDATRKPASIYAYFVAPESGHNLEQAGFGNLGLRFIKAENKEQWLFRRQVNPSYRS